jgi:hypothetical protein
MPITRPRLQTPDHQAGRLISPPLSVGGRAHCTFQIGAATPMQLLFEALSVVAVIRALAHQNNLIDLVCIQTQLSFSLVLYVVEEITEADWAPLLIFRLSVFISELLSDLVVKLLWRNRQVLRNFVKISARRNKVNFYFDCVPKQYSDIFTLVNNTEIPVRIV